MFYQIKLPATMCFLYFRIIIPAFIEIGLEVWVNLRPGMNIIKKQIQLGKGPCGNSIAIYENLGCPLNSDGMHRTPCASLFQRNSQKCCLFIVAFDEIHPTITELREKNRRNDARKAAATAEIDPFLRVRGELKDLRAIRNVPTPKLG